MRVRRRPRAFLVLSGLNLIALVALWLLEANVAERHWLVSIVSYVPQHPLGIVTVLLVIWAVIARDGRGVLLNLPALALFALFFMGFNIPRNLVLGASEGMPLRVMTYNIRGAPLSVSAMRDANADVICVQESRDLEGLFSRLRAGLPGFEAVNDGELTLFSKHPIRSRRVIRLPGSNRVLSEAVLDVHGQRVRVINLHLLTLNIQGRNATDDVASRVTRFSVYRWEAVSKVLDMVNASPDPLIVCGDFNTPPRGRLYNALDAVLDDAFVSAGWGLGFTYSARIPLIRIDYVWTNDRLRAARAFVPDGAASDHRAVVADLMLKP